MSGPLNHSQSQIIRQLLIDLGGGTDPDDDDDWPIYANQIVDSPDSVITIKNTTPRNDGRLMVSGEAQVHEGIQITVRAADHGVCHDKTNDIAIIMSETVLNNTVVIGVGSAYTVYAASLTSGPIDLGKNVDISKRNLFTLNYTVSLRQN